MAKVSLVATDMDGTLLDEEGRIPVGFFAWVNEHPQTRVVIASGRQVYTLMEQFAPIKNQLAYIADNGSVVYEDGKVVYSNVIEPDSVRTVAGIVNKIPHCIPVYCGLKAAYISLEAPEESRRNLEQYYAHRSYIPDPLEALETDQIVKIALYFEEGSSFDYEELMAGLPTGLTHVVSSERWMDIANESANKGSAIRSMQQRHGIPAGECMAFGDYLNDLELLQACGESYAMANAVSAIKNAARYIAPSNVEDGVLRVLVEREEDF